MGGFTVAYICNVDNVDNIELLKQVDNVSSVDKVDEVAKLPHPYFPNKDYKYNYQQGGSLHITNTSNMYQAVYIPENDCEFKGVNICFTSYNIEDTYDVLIGSRYVIRNSNVKEMSEYRMLELYEVVEAGTPIVIQFHNNSGLEKYMLYEIITVLNSEIVNYPDSFEWSFNWNEGNNYTLKEQEVCTLIIPQPNYVNMDSIINTASLNITDLNTQMDICTINIDSDGSISSTYVESEPLYQDKGLLARANIIGIVSMTRFYKAIEIVFKNMSYTGQANVHTIDIGVAGNIINSINGG